MFQHIVATTGRLQIPLTIGQGSTTTSARMSCSFRQCRTPTLPPLSYKRSDLFESPSPAYRDPITDQFHLERQLSNATRTFPLKDPPFGREPGEHNRRSKQNERRLHPGSESPNPATPRKRVCSTKARQRTIQEQDREVPHPAPAIVRTESAKDQSATSDTQSGMPVKILPTPSSPPGSNQPSTMFVQTRREAKKATVEPGLTMVMLQPLFVRQFWRGLGMDSFPAIYIRGGSSGIQYESEDIDEGKGPLSLDTGREFRILALSSAHDDTLFYTHSF